MTFLLIFYIIFLGDLAGKIAEFFKTVFINPDIYFLYIKYSSYLTSKVIHVILMELL